MKPGVFPSYWKARLISAGLLSFLVVTSLVLFGLRSISQNDERLQLTGLFYSKKLNSPLRRCVIWVRDKWQGMNHKEMHRSKWRPWMLTGSPMRWDGGGQGRPLLWHNGILEGNTVCVLRLDQQGGLCPQSPAKPTYYLCSRHSLP